jgi:hypothetical protein
VESVHRNGSQNVLVVQSLTVLIELFEEKLIQ